MIVRILPSARDDLRNGFLFYENQETGLGDYFLDTLLGEIDMLKHQAGIHPIVYDFYHIKYSGKFPYAIYYYLSDDCVVVDAVLDTRRDPQWISDRLN